MSVKLSTAAAAVLIALGTPVDAEARKLGKIVGDAFRAPATIAKKVLPPPLAKPVEAVLTAPAKVVTAAEETSARVAKETERSLTKVVNEAERGAQRITLEAGRGVENVGEAVVTTGELLENEAKNTIKAGEAMAKAIGDGHLDQAVEAATVDRWRRTEDNLAEAVIESSLLRTVAQTAATAYGSAAGGAAFSAWYAYHASGGDWDTALRSGATSYATSYVMAEVGDLSLSEDRLADAAGRTVTAGAVGAGIAAANGGNSSQVKDAFVMAAASQAANEIYKGTAEKELDTRTATEGPIAKSCETLVNCNIPDGATFHYDENGHVQIDVKSLPQNMAHVGKSFGVEAANSISENSRGMLFLAKGVPGMNGMAYFHDIWMAEANISGNFGLMSTIPPAIVMTYMAAGSPQELAAVEKVIESNQ